MNWGKGIVGGMVIFMLFILSMCFYMFRMPPDEYDHRYYEKGLSFDNDYKREQQVTADHAEPLIKQNGKTLELIFSTPVTGNIKFVRPSNQAMDKTFALNSEGAQTVSIPLSSIKRGQWDVVVEWTNNDKEYLYQQGFYIK